MVVRSQFSFGRAITYVKLDQCRNDDGLLKVCMFFVVAVKRMICLFSHEQLKEKAKP
jgi:hypothetical protein